MGRTSPTAPAAATAPTISARRAIAVLPFRNASGQPDAAWISRATPELLSMELSEGEQLRVVPVENVLRALSESKASDPASLSAADLTRVARAFGADLVVDGGKARDSARRAFDLSGELRRQDRLVIEARHREAADE